ncbi:MAG: protein kinase [Polyangiaceae bacterium]|nr:protein kinase [Polyangiaceae bacterium]
MRSFEAGEVVAGKYRLQKPLARGGMGAVWTAWNEQLEVPVAVKFMAAEALGSAELVARFEREAKSAAQLRSPHVVQIYEHGVHSGVPFMVMELLDGEDLSKRLKMRGRLSLDETGRIVTDVCKALRRAEELKIVHRDLKPGNIFLARSGDDEVIKVLDFGIAKITHGTQGDATKTGALMGTPNYMSPEQARRTQHQVDHRSDLWSLGVIAFRAVTGKLPFAGEDAIDVLVRVVTTDAPTATSIAPDLPSKVDSFFSRALARDPNRRFQSAREFAEAFVLATATAGQHPRGAGWGSGAHPALSSNALPNAFTPAPPPVASVPSNIAPQPSVHTAPRAGAQTVPLADPLDGAVTVPIQRSAAGQAILAQSVSTASAGASANAAAGAATPGFAPPASPHATTPQGEDARNARRAALRTMPLPDAAQLVAEAKVLVNVVAPPETEIVSATTGVASEGTITSATGELPVRKKSRTSPMVWVTLLVALLAVGVVGVVVFSAATSASETTQDEPVLFPTGTALPLTADPMLNVLPPTVSPTNLPTPSAAPTGSEIYPTPGGGASGEPTGQPSGSTQSTANPEASAASTSAPTSPSGTGSTPPPKLTGTLPSTKMKSNDSDIFGPLGAPAKK